LAHMFPINLRIRTFIKEFFDKFNCDGLSNGYRTKRNHTNN